MRILMISENPGVAKFLRRGLTAEGWGVDSALTIEKALERLRSLRYDVVLVDLAESQENDSGFLNHLAPSTVSLPVLLLTARRSEPPIDCASDRSVDVLQKPFAFDELIARIEALDHASSQKSRDVVCLNDSLRFDRVNRRLILDQESTPLSEEECRLLAVLTEHQGRSCAKSWLLQAVWNQSAAPIKCPVDATIQSLRRKLGPHSAMITTVRHYGYRFEAPAERTD